jgi:hypothetical protein
MNRKLDPHTMPASTNWTVTDAFDGPRGVAWATEVAVGAVAGASVGTP